MLAYAAAREPKLAAVVATIGGVGAGLLALVLVRCWDEALVWALLLLGLAYALATVAHGAGIDEAAPLVAAGMLLSAELAVWSLDERWAIAAERLLVVARGAAVLALAAAGLVAAALVLALAAAPVGGGLAWTMLGAAAAVFVLALAARLAR